MTSLRTRQINPVVHQAHAGFVLPRHKTISTIAVHRPFILNLHTVSLIKAVFDIGENTAEGLQRFPLGRDDQIPVNVRPEDLKRIDSPRGPDRDSDLTLYLKEKGDGTRKKYKTFLLITAFAGTAAAAYFCLWICLWGRFLN